MNKQLVHSVFEQVAHAQGGRIAVEHAATQVTYAELNGYANQIAHCLLSQRAAGQVVGAFFESSVAYVAAILGINKAGGAFMPLEPDFPAKRLLFLLESARPAVVVTDAAHLALLLDLLGDPALAARPERIVVVSHSPGSLSVELLDPRGEGLPPAATASANPGVALTGEDPNYIIYTSGSTGQPKLIEGCHKGLSHFVHWEIKEFALDASVRVSQLAPVSFDVSFRDIFVPLLTGGCLCIPPKDIRFQPAALLRWLHASRVSLMHCVPTVLRLLTEEIKNAPEGIALTDHLQYVLLAGEALYGKDVMNWRHAAGDRIELVNVYGPSETTLAKMFHRIPAVPVEPASIIPLGKAISNTLVMILKEDRLCEIGETGEIYIKTPFRSRGYYRNPALTGERFVQNPLNGEDLDILYKTGDLGRYTETMDVVFAGREDDQVKIRGNRVEVAEAERRLMGMPGVDRAVVRVYAREAGDEMLIGYYSGGTALPEKEIRTYLKDFLPEYMIPAAYVRVPDFPLNRNGKIDRQALPAPELGKADAYEAPENELERKLEEIWKTVLNLPRVGRRESFFDVGGSSLKGIKIVARMLKTFEVMVKLPDLFANPTIAELASLLATSLKKSFQEIKPLPAGQPYYEASRAQRRLWILSQFQDNNAAYNISYGYWLDGRLDAAAFRRAVGALLERYEVLRTVFVMVDGEPMQKINPAAAEHFSLSELAFADDEAGREQVRQLAEAEAATPFDLTNGPLVRIKLVSLSAEKSALILTLHHIISDGWSMNVFFHDLLVAYESYRTGTAPALKPLKFQYKDYAAWQNQLLSGAELRDHQDYWLGCFNGNLPLIDLPHDKPRPATKTHHGAIAWLHVPAGVAAPLKKLAQRGEATLFMLLLASVKTLLHKYSGQEDLIIGIPVAGREHADLDNQIGLFVNTLAIRTALRPDEPFEKVLQSVKERTLGAYKHQAYPFDQLVDNLDLARDLSRSVLFDVMVVLHDTRQAAMEAAAPSMNGVALRSIGIDSRVTKFDMAFNFAESEGGFNLRLEYNTGLFSPARIEAIFGHYLTLLTAIAARPGTPVGLLSLLPAAESEAILRRDRNTIEGPYAGSGGVVEQLVKYGRLKAGYQFYVGDSYGALRPEGLAGDLYIACDAAAAPAAFAAEPHPSDPGRVLIRTGERGMLLDDVVRYLGPSSAEHLLNGRWINLEYIAGHLRRFAGVESATVAIAGQPGEKQRLVAWLTAAEQPDSGELADYLALHLAAHMVPEHFIFRADGQLPVPDADWNQWLPTAGESAPRAYAPPRNPVEAQLSEIVAEVMGKGQMSIRDNFFEAGFHSLKAIRLMSAIYKQMGIKFNLAKVFANPTIEKLGKLIDDLHPEVHARLLPLPAAPDYPASAAQQDLWLRRQAGTGNLVSTYRIRGPLQAGLLEQALQTLVARHESLRTAFHQVDGELRQAIAAAADFPPVLRETDLRAEARPAGHVAELVKEQALAGFVPGEAPLLRVALLRTEEAEWILVLVVHGSVADEASVRILAEDLLDAYAAHATHGGAAAEPSKIHYKEYAYWQARQLAGEPYRQHRAYWEEELDKAAAAAVLPADKPRPATGTGQGAVLAGVPDPALKRQVEQVAATSEAPVPVVLHAALAVLVQGRAGGAEVVIGMLVAGREPGELERVVGCFAQTLPVRTPVAGNDTFAQVIEQTKQARSAASVHQAYPLALLAGAPEGGLPVCRVQLVVESENPAPLLTPLPGLAVTPEPAAFTISRYDLTFHFSNEAEGLRLDIAYNTDLYAESTVREMQKQLGALLGRVAVQPGTPVQNLAPHSGDHRPEYVPGPPAAATRPGTPAPAAPRPVGDVSALIARLRSQGIQVELQGDQLRLNATRNQGGQAPLAPELVTEVKAAKAEIVAFLRGMLTSQYQPIPLVAGQAHYRASHGQRRLWVLEQFGGLDGAYNIPLALELKGTLDRNALEQALQSLVRRHEILRTRILAVDGEPVQQIDPAGATPLRLAFQNLEGDPQAEAQAEAIGQRERSTGFDLATGPLLRAVLVRLSASRHLFFLTVHHVISDGWSQDLMGMELMTLYRRRAGGDFREDAPLRVQYKDYAAWQATELSGSRVAQHREYWHSQFGDGAPVLDFPADFPRPAVKTYRGVSIKAQEGEERLAEVRNFVRAHNCSLFMLFQTVVLTLLYRYTGQDDLVVGTPIAGREHPDLEDQLGFYVNTLALRRKLNGADSFGQLLAQVREQTLEAYCHQVYPFDLLVEEVVLERDLSRSPLFDVLLMMETSTGSHSAETTGQEGLLISKHKAKAANEQSKYDLSVTFRERHDYLEIGINYNPDLYAPARMEQMLAHLQQLLASAVRQPGQPLNQIDFLAAAERKALARLSGGSLAYPAPETTLQALFEGQAARTPERTAVVCGDRTLSYADLNARSNRLAHCLIGRGIGPEDLVGVLTDRNETTVEILLGILKAGAGYVPVDMAYPVARKRFLLDDSAVKLLIADAAPDGWEGDVLAPADWQGRTDLPAANPEGRSRGDNAAYVIYTSGSTGTPKGVLIEHRNAVAFLEWCREEFGSSDFELVLAGTSLCFDLSVYETFYPLSTGKPVRVLPSNLDIRHYLPGHKLLVNTVPSVVAELLRAGADLSGVSVLNMAGEPIPAFVPGQLDCPQREVRNLYGPSEDTTYSTCYRLTGAETSIPVGKPIRHTRAYVLDDQLQPQPVGLYGEIWLSGAGVARGYLNREGLTAERFVDDPFSPGWRMYRTGDRGRWNWDGVLEYGGRRDFQWKVRGYRIEAGEIESLVQAHPHVEEAVVMALAVTGEDPELVCYYRSAGEIPVEELRGHLGQRLPGYMVPAYYVHQEAFPLNANGKLDRSRLPRPRPGQRRGAYVAPVTPVEQKLADLWGALLDKTGIGAEDNFFEMGGHSLKAIRLAALVYKELNVELSLKTIFMHPTIRQMAREIENLNWLNQDDTLPGDNSDCLLI